MAAWGNDTLDNSRRMNRIFQGEVVKSQNYIYVKWNTVLLFNTFLYYIAVYITVYI